MYRCIECGNLFENGEEKRYNPGTGEEFKACPVCKGDYIEVKPCKICGTYEHNQDELYCEDCKSKVKNKFADFVEKNFSIEERKLLNEMYDGEPI